MAQRFVRRVRTFDQDALTLACRDLWGMAGADGDPDLLVGVRTGGFLVAETMVRAMDPATPILPLTCRRSSTAAKRASPDRGRWLRRLPRPARDRLRLAEHAVLTRRGPMGTADCSGEPDELDALRSWATEAGPAPRVLVVEDAVDRGVTLAAVLAILARLLPPDANVRSAAITVTTAEPLVMPDHVLLRGWLCRFPWSLDA